MVHISTVITPVPEQSLERYLDSKSEPETISLKINTSSNEEL